MRGLYLLGLAAVAAVAYLLGAKAGRRRYREIIQTANSVWNDPAVRKARSRAKKKAQQTIRRASKKLS